MTPDILSTSTAILAAVNLGGGVIVTTLVILGCIALLWVAFGYFGTPEPILKFAHIFLIVCAVVVLIWALLTLTGVRLP